MANPDLRVKRRRAWLARGIIVVAGIALLAGIVIEHYTFRAPDPWRARLVRGEPVEVRFLCGVNLPVDCRIKVKLSYQKQESKWCAKVQSGDQRDGTEQLCDADPEHGTISILGVVYSFDRYGFLRIDDHLVGQLLAG